MFGELALEENEDDDGPQRRMVSVSAVTDCEVAVLPRDQFLELLYSVKDRVSYQRACFLRQIPFFENQSFKGVKKFSLLFDEKDFIRQQYIFKQGQIPQQIYIVVKGDFEILRTYKNKYKLVDPLKSAI